MSASALAAVRGAIARPPAPARPPAIALLGLGRIGSAVAQLIHEGHAPARLTAALVRDPDRSRAHCPPLDVTVDVEHVFAAKPDVIVEVLGGLEPARTIALAALRRGIPVVTANKTLVAHHGRELLDAAACAGVPFRYEACVLAGVPFLGTFAARPLAARVSALAGIVNGTSNYVLSRASADGVAVEAAIADAQRHGFAEPDPASDIDGVDAAQKLAVLGWHFGFGSIAPGDIETRGLRDLQGDDLAAAAALGGAVKPVACIGATAAGVTGFVGPAFVPATHRLAGIEGVENAVALETASGRLFFSGPGAGPLATATTILDDVGEAVRGVTAAPRSDGRAVVAAPSTAWFVRVDAGDLDEAEVTAFLGAHGVWSRRAHARGTATWRLTYACSRGRIDAALASLSSATGGRALALRAVEA